MDPPHPTPQMPPLASIGLLETQPVALSQKAIEMLSSDGASSPSSLALSGSCFKFEWEKGKDSSQDRKKGVSEATAACLN